MDEISIIIADDHPIFRNGLANVIREEKSFSIIYEANNGQEAFDSILLKKPDVAILDIKMPFKTGIEVVEELTGKNLKTRIVFLTMYKEEEWFRKAMQLGVSGYVLKECAVDDIIDCIKTVAEGKHYISPIISTYLVDYARKTQLADFPIVEKLTVTERKILLHIADKLTSRQIADNLNVSIRTIENHRNNICSKMNIHGVNSLLKFALDNKGIL
ncbi:MAG: response regulator transcription factor [Ignavibacteriales bacterium]|nr:response regulator transcription factor [Ignavibacteriales bacterium]